MKLKELSRRIAIALRRMRRPASRNGSSNPTDFQDSLNEPGHEPSRFEPVDRMPRVPTPVIAGALLVALGVTLWFHQPVATVQRGEVGIRSNALTGNSDQFRDGTVLVLPLVHSMRTFDMRDRVYAPTQSVLATGPAPFQSHDGQSVGVDLSVRYALDPTRLASIAKDLPDDLDGAIVQPAIQGTVYKIFARYTVREIFSTKRGEIQQLIEAELKPKLAADGVLLRGVQMGKIDLPSDYRRGMEQLLAEELATEKMQYTLALKAKQVEESAMEADAEKMRRQKAAEASATEQVIAAKAQEEAMRHILPFKQKQIEQRQLEAEADKAARIRSAEGQAQARRIEAAGEADSRRQLADAEGYRQEHLGKIASQQLARDGAVISRHPLLIQKTMAEKLSDKIQVIIAPPSTSGGLITAGLLGGSMRQTSAKSAPTPEDGGEGEDTNTAGAQ